mgnify:FL=1
MGKVINTQKDPPFASRHPMGKKNKMEGARGQKSKPEVKKVVARKGIKV